MILMMTIKFDDCNHNDIGDDYSDSRGEEMINMMMIVICA